MPTLNAIQSACVAVVTSAVGIAVGYGILDNAGAQLISAFAGALIGLGFMVASAIENHAKIKAAALVDASNAPPTKL